MKFKIFNIRLKIFKIKIIVESYFLIQEKLNDLLYVEQNQYRNIKNRSTHELSFFNPRSNTITFHNKIFKNFLLKLPSSKPVQQVHLKSFAYSVDCFHSQVAHNF